MLTDSLGTDGKTAQSVSGDIEKGQVFVLSVHLVSLNRQYVKYGLSHTHNLQQVIVESSFSNTHYEASGLVV